MTRKPIDYIGESRRGSALLIVLGFLSFMMISAVAFAVYMRIERQASSNYRHAAGARHILNSALYRAIEDVDLELRTNPDAAFSRKFPLFPVGAERSRVLTSVTNDSGDDSQKARVLTLEALAYIPGLLVNHVRHFATSDANCAEWRSVSMPYSDMRGGPSYNEMIVGRYAYACVNVSDMINVNNCRATARGAGSNQVSIAYLFNSAAQCDTFEKNREKDFFYHTLNDFYACMYEHNDPVFRSPYHEFLDSLVATVRPFDRPEMKNHILVTDGKARAEPRGADAVNILEIKPIANLSPLDPTISADFYNAFTSIFPGGFDGNNLYKTAFVRMLADYLDEDHVPKSFDYPSPEIRPMICQMSVMAPGFPVFEKRTVPGASAGDPSVDEIFINLAKIPVPLPFSVKTVYPFLQTIHQRNLGSAYQIEVEVFLRIHPASKSRFSLLGGRPPIPAEHYYVRYTGTMTLNVNRDIRSGGVNPNEPYTLTPMDLIPELLGGNEVIMWNSKEGFKVNNFGPEPVMITLVVGLAAVKDDANRYVNVMPIMAGAQNGNIPADYMARFLSSAHMLYFESTETSALGPAFNEAVNPTLKWSCLETPDPRFNGKVANWITSADAQAQQQPNQSTLALLSDGTGRDGDIFMSASNAGELLSPGELGFLIRPYVYDPSHAPVDFNTQTSVDRCADKNVMFRTIRLYDHGALPRDNVFDYFYAADAKGFALGTRVNPLSDIPNVLRAAIENVPMDYHVAQRNTEDIRDGRDPALRGYNFSEHNEFRARWSNIVDAWQRKLENTIQNPPNVGGQTIDIKRNFGRNLRDMYFDNAAFTWYDEQRNTIFGQSFGGVNLYEVDRKMLYAFTLDSFADSQQLFLYFLNAETTASAFGSRSRSTAGGKAIALVWRDPYPSNFKRGDPEPTPQNNTSFHNHEILYFKYLDN